MIALSTASGQLVNFDTRSDTNDAALATAILGEDEYLLRGHAPLTGWALDIGSHIGTVAIALATDHPNLKVIAVEPVPDNAEVVRANVARNCLQGRVFVEEAAAGDGKQTSIGYAYTVGNTTDQGYVEQNRYIGNIWHDTVSLANASVCTMKTFTIVDLAVKYGVERFAFAKIDCEGCEWDFLRKGAGRIDEIVGEWHDAGPDRISRLLAKTHSVEIIADHGGNGIFRAVRL